MVDHKMNVTAAAFAMVTGQAKVSVHGPLPTEHPFYANIGRVASEWAHLEHTLDLIIWDLLGLAPKLTACLTAQIMGVGPRCKVIASLGAANGLSPADLKPFRALMSDSYVAADMRARIVHDPWYAELNSQTPAQFKAMAYSDQRYGLHDVTETEIDDTIGKIKALQKRASDLRNSVLAALATLRGTHP